MAADFIGGGLFFDALAVARRRWGAYPDAALKDARAKRDEAQPRHSKRRGTFQISP